VNLVCGHYNSGIFFFKFLQFLLFYCFNLNLPALYIGICRIKPVRTTSVKMAVTYQDGGMVGDGAEDGWRGSNHLEYQQHRGIPVCLSFSRPNLRQLSWACAGTFQAWSSNTARNTPSLISRPAVLYAGRNIPYSFFWPAALYTGKNNFHITFLHCLALSALVEIFPNHFIRPFRSLHSDIYSTVSQNSSLGPGTVHW
jgi:hypothetical protein